MKKEDIEILQKMH